MTAITSIKSPIIRYGGKFALRKWIISHFPKHSTYVEPFGGAAHVLLAKPMAKCEVYNDLDDTIVNFWRVIRDAESAELLCQMLEMTPYSRSEFLACRNSIRNLDLSNIERARIFCVLNKQSFAAKGRDWGYNTDGHSVKNWLSMPITIRQIASRIRGVTIENKDACSVIKAFDTPSTLHYCDPPYMENVRKKENCYTHEMSDAEHVKLLQTILSVSGMVVISGYNNELYNSMLLPAGWTVKTKSVNSASAGGRNKGESARIECLWLSPSTVEKLQNGTICNENY